MPPITNLDEEEIVDALGNDGNASMPEQVSRPKPWGKMMMIMMMMNYDHKQRQFGSQTFSTSELFMLPHIFRGTIFHIIWHLIHSPFWKTGSTIVHKILKEHFHQHQSQKHITVKCTNSKFVHF